MLVEWKPDSGEPITWRVGRRRIAWRPRSFAFLLAFADEPFFVPVMLGILIYHLAMWPVTMIATAVVLPIHAIRDRWPVVAYPLGDEGDHGFQRIWVTGKAQADAVAQQWALDIQEQGYPQTSTSIRAPQYSPSA